MKILVEREQEEETAKQLISEASAKLSTAMKGKDLQQAKVAQVMLETGTAKLHDTSKEIQKIRATVEKLNMDINQLEFQLVTVNSNCEPSTKRPRKD